MIHFLLGFGLWMAASGMAASWKRGMEGRNLPPRKGGARLSSMDGMPREATQAVMGSGRNKARLREAVPEMRSAIDKASTLSGAQSPVVDLGDDSCVDNEEAVGSDKGAAVRFWPRRFCALKEYLTPSIAVPIRDNFLGILGRRVRRLEMSDTQERSFLPRGTYFRAALKVQENANPEVLVQARDRGEAANSQKNKKRPPQ